jgi:hypothetical protein
MGGQPFSARVLVLVAAVILGALSTRPALAQEQMDHIIRAVRLDSGPLDNPAP